MIVLIAGMPAAGKTTLTKYYVDDGYYRINRDTLGGKLKNLHEYVLPAYQAGHRKFVLDNTYRNVESRRPIIETAKQLGLPIKCVLLNTSLEDAQFNACQRMIEMKGKLLHGNDFKRINNPNLFPPAALFGYRKEFEEPTTNEGFDEVEVLEFVRNPTTNTEKALILDFDDTLRTCDGPEDYPLKPEQVKLLPNRSKKIQQFRDLGYHILGVSNQSGVAKGKLSYNDAVDCFEKTCELLGQKIDYRFCPHSVPPVNCFCRKPSSGLGALLIHEYKLDPSNSIFVGDQTSDKTFATRCGFQYFHPEEFFNEAE